MLLAASMSMSAPVLAGTKAFTASGNTLSADKPVNILLMRPDVQVGTLTTGGVVEPNADWTATAKANILERLRKNQEARQSTIAAFDPGQNDSLASLENDYEALHRAVAAAILAHKYYGAKLPTKVDRFDWTLGPGAAALGQPTGSTYGLFIHVRDNFASGGRKAMQAAGMLGCLVGFCVIASGGQHVYYASLVDLASGDIVWFNVLRGSKGDVREEAGAQGMVDALMASMPNRPGASAGTKTASR